MLDILLWKYKYYIYFTIRETLGHVVQPMGGNLMQLKVNEYEEK